MRDVRNAKRREILGSYIEEVNERSREELKRRKKKRKRARKLLVQRD